MKILFKSFIYTLLLIMVSCADKDPIEIGQIDLKAEVEQVTATTAVLIVKAPESNKQLIQKIVFIHLNDESASYTDLSQESTNSDTEKRFILYNLKPSTTYDVSVSVEAKDTEYGYVSVDVTKFTTASEGDYSALNLKASYQLIKTFGNVAQIDISLPEGVKYQSYPDLLWSTSSDMKEAKSAQVSLRRDEGKEVFYAMPGGLEKDQEYFLQLSGDFKYFETDLKDVKIPFNETLKISSAEQIQFTCELVMATSASTSVKIKLPENVTFGYKEHTIYWRTADDAVTAWESQKIEYDRYNDIEYGARECTVTLPALTPNENGYQLGMDGNFCFSDLNGEEISTMLYSAENLKITPDDISAATCSLEFYYGNEAVVNFQLADNLEFHGKGVVIMNPKEDFSGQSIETEYQYYNTSNQSFKLSGFDPSETYYFKLKGNFEQKENNNKITNLYDETIDVKGSVKLQDSGKAITPGTCELMISGDNFNVVRFNLPQKTSLSQVAGTIYYNEQENFNITDLTTNSVVSSGWNNYVTGNLPKLEVGKTYYFKTQNTIYYDDDFHFNFNDVIIPFSGSITRPPMDETKANYETVFDCKDFTALRLILPSNIVMNRSVELKYSSDKEPLKLLDSPTMFFPSLPPATYNLSINGDAMYMDDMAGLNLGRVNMDIAEPFTTAPGDKYLIEVSRFTDGSKECIALTRSSELIKFDIYSAGVRIHEGNNTVDTYLNKKNQTEGVLTFEIPTDYKLEEGKEYTITYVIQLQFIDQTKYGDTYHQAVASYSFVYNGPASESTKTRSGVKGQCITKLKSASISSQVRSKHAQKAAKRTETTTIKSSTRR